MERHGHDQLGLFRDAGLPKTGGQNPRERERVLLLPGELQRENEVADGAGVMGGGDGPVEPQGHVAAVDATGGVLRVRPKLVAALRARGVDDEVDPAGTRETLLSIYVNSKSGSVVNSD